MPNRVPKNAMRPVHPGESWMNLQVAFEIRTAERTLAKKVEKEVAPLAA